MVVKRFCQWVDRWNIHAIAEPQLGAHSARLWRCGELGIVIAHNSNSSFCMRVRVYWSSAETGSRGTAPEDLLPRN